MVIVKCVYMSCLYLYFQESIWFGYYFMQKIETLPLDFYSCSLGDLVWREGKENPSLPFHHMLSRQLAKKSGLHLCFTGQKKSLVLEHGTVSYAENWWGGILCSQEQLQMDSVYSLFSANISNICLYKSVLFWL